MGFKILPKDRMSDWVQHLARHYRVVGPQPRHGQHVFGEIRSWEEMDIDYSTSVIPPKKYLLPMQEDLFHFDVSDGGGVRIVRGHPQTVILGMHTCDLHAIQLLDQVFVQDYNDQHYMDRRENTFLVSVECLQPCMPESFCKDMGTFTVTDGYDIHLTDLGSNYAVDIGTLKGAMLIEGFDGVREANEEDYRQVNQVMGEKWPNFPMRLELDITELPGLLETSYDSPLWTELGERCLACGTCTTVCPTCYCFDVSDEVDLKLRAGKRYRRADSCQLEEFAIVAGGHNFRRQLGDRQRHRFFRKGKYQMETHNLIGCVGCGRCAQQCLVHITPVDTYNELYRRHQQAGQTEEAKEVAS